MGLSEEMKHCCTYCDMRKKLPVFVTVCQKRNNQICQRRVEKAAQNKGGGIGFPSPNPSPSTKAPETAPAGTVAGYTGPTPMDLSAGRRRISAEERVKSFTDGRCCTVVGLTTGRQNVRQGRPLRRLRPLEQRLRM